MRRLSDDSEKQLVHDCQTLLNLTEPPLGYLEVAGQRRARGAGNSLGLPDAFLHVAGQTLCIEFKRADGRLSKWQQLARKCRAEHGVETHVVRDVGDFALLVNGRRKEAWRARSVRSATMEP